MTHFTYVYILQSISDPDHHYIGMTKDLEARLKTHNAGQVRHTSKFLPWQIETTFAFRERDKAVAFEKYLKTQSGRAFAKKRF